jgi:nucleotide-binding universal stress UspA family protein
MRRFRKILFLNRPGLDDSHAYKRAVRLAEENGAELKIIEVHATVTPGPEMENQRLSHSALISATKAQRQLHLERMAKPYNKQIHISTDIFFGVSFIETIMEVQRHGHDLVVLAPEKHNLGTMIFGSADMHLLRKCPSPVWIVKPGSDGPFQNIMAAVDMDSSDDRKELLNQQIIELAASLAREEASKLHIAHAWAAPYSNLTSFNDHVSTTYNMESWVEDVHMSHKSWLTKLVESYASKQPFGSKPDVHLIQGEAGEVIPQLVKQKNIDLLVMGTVARTGITGFLIGNTAENIISRLNCSLLAVKPEGFICPIPVDQDPD